LGGFEPGITPHIVAVNENVDNYVDEGGCCGYFDLQTVEFSSDANPNRLERRPRLSGASVNSKRADAL
jgi:hypothetical protein